MVACTATLIGDFLRALYSISNVSPIFLTSQVLEFVEVLKMDVWLCNEFIVRVKYLRAETILQLWKLTIATRR